MGFLNKVFKSISLTGYSFKKSKELRRLQLIIWPPDKDILKSTDLDEIQKQDDALNKFFDLCENDEGVILAMNSYGATRETLKELYDKLIDAGSGQWIKGHFVALSALAYFEPLSFCLGALKKGSPDFTKVAWNMLEYFRGNPLEKN